VPFIGGSAFKAGSGTLNKRSLNASIRDVVRHTEPKKYKVVDHIYSQDLLANTIYTWNPLGNIPIGTGENQRLSTEIYVTRIGLKLAFLNNEGLGSTFTRQVNCRVMWVRSEAQYGSGSDAFGSGLGLTDLFYAGQTIPTFAFPDNDKCTILSDTMVRIPALAYSGAQESAYREIDAPIGSGMTFKYSSLTGDYSTKSKNIYCVIACQIPGDVTGTTVDARLEWQGCVEYRDSA
jgi:hypothetical protein